MRIALLDGGQKSSPPTWRVRAEKGFLLCLCHRHLSIEKPGSLAVIGTLGRSVIVQVKDSAGISAHPVVEPPYTPRTTT